MHLGRHMDTHSVAKWHLACTFSGCTRRFSRRDNLQRHISQRHAQYRPSDECSIAVQEDINASKLPHRSLILQAVQSRDHASLSSLLKWGIDLDEVDHSGNDALHVAVGSKDIELVMRILEHTNGTRLRPNKDGDTALHRAAKLGQLEMVRLLIDRYCQEANKRGFTALHVAACHGRERVVEFLLQNGAEIDRRCLRGWTALFMAAGSGQYKVVSLLLRSGACPDLCDKIQGKWYPARSLLYCAAKSGSETCCQVILDSQVVLPEQSTGNMSVALRVAARLGHCAIISLLLGRLHSNSYRLAWDLAPAANVAASQGRYDVLKLLLAKGSIIESRYYGSRIIKSSADWAVQSGDWSIMELVIEKEAFVDGRDTDEAVRLAKIHGARHVVELLRGKQRA